MCLQGEGDLGRVYGVKSGPDVQKGNNAVFFLEDMAFYAVEELGRRHVCRSGRAEAMLVLV